MAGTDSLDVDPTNADQVRAWDGDEGAYWAAHADHFDRAVAPHHERLLAASAIGADDRVLDVGCGTGQTTRDAARAASDGSALGVDLSAAMLDVARERARAEGLFNAQFLRADAQVHPFPVGTFDVVLSRTGAMFFGDLPTAFANLARAMRPDGRLVLLTWQELARNEWIRQFSAAMAAGRDVPPPPPDAPGPFALAQPDRVHTVLSTAGFVEIDLEPVNEPMWFGDDADDAYRFVAGLLGWMLEGLEDAPRRRALDALHDAMTAHETPDGVLFQSAAWLVRARNSR